MRKTQRQIAHRLVTYAGRTQTIAAWAAELGIPRQRLRTRLFVLGMPMDLAATPGLLRTGPKPSNGVHGPDAVGDKR